MKTLEDNYLDDKDPDDSVYRKNIGKYFEQHEDYTVGEMFSDLDYPQAHHRREALAEPTTRATNVEQPYNRYIDDAAYKTAASKLGPYQHLLVEMMTLGPAVQEV